MGSDGLSGMQAIDDGNAIRAFGNAGHSRGNGIKVAVWAPAHRSRRCGSGAPNPCSAGGSIPAPATSAVNGRQRKTPPPAAAARDAIAARSSQTSPAAGSLLGAKNSVLGWLPGRSHGRPGGRDGRRYKRRSGRTTPGAKDSRKSSASRPAFTDGARAGLEAGKRRHDRPAADSAGLLTG
jgi:hypothetical protein